MPAEPALFDIPATPPVPATGTPGSESSPPTPRLNPRFVEWLMGLPLGWTDYEPVGTEFFRWQQRMHGAFCALGSESSA